MIEGYFEWLELQDRMKALMTPAAFEAYFAVLDFKMYLDNTLYVTAPKQFIKDIVHSKFKTDIEAILGEIRGEKCLFVIELEEKGFQKIPGFICSISSARSEIDTSNRHLLMVRNDRLRNTKYLIKNIYYLLETGVSLVVIGDSEIYFSNTMDKAISCGYTPKCINIEGGGIGSSYINPKMPEVDKTIYYIIANRFSPQNGLGSEILNQWLRSCPVYFLIESLESYTTGDTHDALKQIKVAGGRVLGVFEGMGPLVQKISPLNYLYLMNQFELQLFFNARDLKVWQKRVLHSRSRYWSSVGLIEDKIADTIHAELGLCFEKGRDYFSFKPNEEA